MMNTSVRHVTATTSGGMLAHVNAHFFQHRPARLVLIGCMGIMAASVLGPRTSHGETRDTAMHHAGQAMTPSPRTTASVVLVAVGVMCGVRSPFWWRDDESDNLGTMAAVPS